MKKQIFAATALGLCLSLTQIAQAAPTPEPQVCPSVAAIQAIGVSRNVVQDNDGLWMAGRRDQKYNTNNDWTFILGKIPAPTASSAYNRAVVALQSLNFQLGPLNGPLGKWICWYSTSQGFTAVAINPPIANNNPSIFLNR